MRPPFSQIYLSVYFQVSTCVEKNWTLCCSGLLVFQTGLGEASFLNAVPQRVKCSISVRFHVLLWSTMLYRGLCIPVCVNKWIKGKHNFLPFFSPNHILSVLSFHQFILISANNVKAECTMQSRGDAHRMYPRPSSFCLLISSLPGLLGIWAKQVLENKLTILTVGQIKTRHHLRTTKEKFTTSLVCVFLPQMHNLNPSGGNIQQLERHYAN